MAAPECLGPVSRTVLGKALSDQEDSTSCAAESNGFVRRRKSRASSSLRASVPGKDAKKNLRSYPLQESLLIVRKERTGHKVRHD